MTGAILVALTVSASAAHAPAEQLPNSSSNLRLIVVEDPGCIYCGVFRRNVAPAYASTPRADTLPLQYLDLNDPAADAISFAQPVTIVPTVVLVDGNREVSRIPGYVGRSNFFRLIKHMLAGY